MNFLSQSVAKSAHILGCWHFEIVNFHVHFFETGLFLSIKHFIFLFSIPVSCKFLFSEKIINLIFNRIPKPILKTHEILILKFSVDFLKIDKHFYIQHHLLVFRYLLSRQNIFIFYINWKLNFLSLSAVDIKLVGRFSWNWLTFLHSTLFTCIQKLTISGICFFYINWK